MREGQVLIVQADISEHKTKLKFFYRFCSNKHKFYGWRVTTDGLASFKEKTEPTPVIGNSGLQVISEFNEYVSTSMDSCFNRKLNHRRNHPNVNNEDLISYKPLVKLTNILIRVSQKTTSFSDHFESGESWLPTMVESFMDFFGIF